MAFNEDPGGVFASDTHRRTLGHLTGDAMSVADLVHRLRPDANSGLTGETEELEDVLADLEADGHAAKGKDGWKQTKAGMEALSAPVGDAA